MPKKKKIFHLLRGMKDILPEDSPYWFWLRKAGENLARSYNFSYIQTPILEKKELFERSTGKESEVVKKQMFSFRTKGGDSVVLRPEFTPAIIRSYLEQGMSSWPQPVKLFYFGPVFRYERPQQGREREFHQFGFEIIGSSEPAYDAQVILILWKFLKSLKIKTLTVKINDIGCQRCRKKYIRLLKKYYQTKKKLICSDCRERLKSNPLRVLDCKNPKCQEIKKGAPIILDHLCQSHRENFKEILEILDNLKVPYLLDPYLVRGLDYYSDMVFEIFAYDVEEIEKEINPLALAAGGRYNNLIKELGGKSVPALGGAIGVERVIDLLKERKISAAKQEKSQLFLVQLGKEAKKQAVLIFEELIKEGFRVKENFAKESLKAQMQLADREKIPFVLILGQKEVFSQTIIFKDMETGIQEEIPLKKLIPVLKKRLKK